MKVDTKLMEKDLQRNPFDSFMDFHLEKTDEESTILLFNNEGTSWNNPNGTTYGGVLYAMADSAMETACRVMGKAVLTLDLAMNYLSPTYPNTVVRAEARVIHNGRTTMVALCDFYDNNNRYLAHGKGTFFVTGPYEVPLLQGGDEVG